VLDGAGSLYGALEDLTGNLLGPKAEMEAKKEKPAVVKKEVDESVKVVKEKVKEKANASAGEIVPAPGEMYVVVGSFKVESNAERLKDKLQAKGYPVVTFRNKNGLLCAALGAYKEMSVAQEALGKIRQAENMEGWIFKN
jgi:cell division septation protein DedD